VHAHKLTQLPEQRPATNTARELVS